MNEESKGIVLTEKEPKKKDLMFPIRHKTTRELKDAFSENEEFFLGMIGQIQPLSGVYSVGFFDKQFWVRA